MRERSAFEMDILYGVVTPMRPAIRMTCRVDDVEPGLRRGYLRRMFTTREYRNLSRKSKVKFRRVILNMEVPRD